MEKNIISKKEFCKAINNAKFVSDYQDGLNDYFRRNEVDGYIFQPDCVDTVINILHLWFGDTDKNEWISYFCWELDFGRKYEKGKVLDKDGEEIPLGNAEDLYDLLIKNLED